MEPPPAWAAGRSAAVGAVLPARGALPPAALRAALASALRAAAPLLRRLAARPRTAAASAVLAAAAALLARAFVVRWLDWQRRLRLTCLSVHSPLYGARWKQALPKRRWYGGAGEPPSRWEGNCGICKRPIDLELCDGAEFQPKPVAPERKGRFAFVITLWGTSTEYVLGALVLGHSLRKTGSRHSLVCLYADDVPRPFLKLLSHVWDCRLVEHVNAVPTLSHADQTHRFAKVFTKLRVMELDEFEKVLLMDIDLLVMANIDHLFKLKAPAAMRRGMNEGSQPWRHGDPIDGSHFFLGRDWKSKEQGQSGWSWGQATGINAGVMLLQPDREVFAAMLSELEEANHPAHIRSNGPEQDYLSRFWADAPWTHIGVEYNFQLHQMFFALQPERTQGAERALLLRRRDRIKIVHFSGTAMAKPWQRILHESFDGLWPDRRRDAEFARIFAEEFAGYSLWVVRSRAAWESRTSWTGPKGRLDLDTQGMHLGADGHIYRNPMKEGGAATKVVIPSDIIDGAMALVDSALRQWFDTFEDLEQVLGLDLRRALRRAASEASDRPAAPAGAAVQRGPTARAGAWSAGAPERSWRGSWQRANTATWWSDSSVQAGPTPASSAAVPRVVSTCFAAPGCDAQRCVRFVEAGAVVFAEEGESLAGVFAKVVGDHAGRHFAVPGVEENGEDSSEVVDRQQEAGPTKEEILAPIHLWVSTVPEGAVVLLALVCIQSAYLQPVLQALAPLGASAEPPPAHARRALAAVVRRGRGAVESTCVASHASADAAVAASR